MTLAQSLQAVPDSSQPWVSAEAKEELTTATPPWIPGQWEDWARGKTHVLGSGYGLGAAQAEGVCAEGSGDSAQPSALCPFSASWGEAGG